MPQILASSVRSGPVALTDIDRDLLKRCVAAEPGGWNDFVDRFLGLFHHVIQHTAQARSAGLSRPDIDDFCAEIFLTILANDYAVLKHFKGHASLATYLAVIARRVTVRELMKRRTVSSNGRLADIQIEAKDQQRIESREEVQRMLDGLPEQEAQIVRQYHLEGRSYREISRGLGIPENSIGPALSRARDRIRARA